MAKAVIVNSATKVWPLRNNFEVVGEIVFVSYSRHRTYVSYPMAQRLLTNFQAAFSDEPNDYFKNCQRFRNRTPYRRSVNISLKPAPENTGYIFVRTDLDNFEIPASVEYISHCSYATTLMRRGVVLSTCEHLLSALRGGLDNCFIEIDSIELPIMDGSSEDFIELIEQAGITKQECHVDIFGY